jgi:hypothetical protein
MDIEEQELVIKGQIIVFVFFFFLLALCAVRASLSTMRHSPQTGRIMALLTSGVAEKEVAL